MRKIIICVILLFAISSVVAESFFEFSPGVSVKANQDQYIVVRFKEAGSAESFVKSFTLFTDSSGIASTNLQTNYEQLDADIYIIKNQSLFINEASNIIKEVHRGPFSMSK